MYQLVISSNARGIKTNSQLLLSPTPVILNVELCFGQMLINQLFNRKLITKTPDLNQTFPDHKGNIMLKILKQPEAQHRARYMTEGSRGAVKDFQQQSHPSVQVGGDC